MFAWIDGNRIFKPQLVWIWRMPIPSYRDKAGSVHVIWMNHTRCVIGVFNIPKLNLMHWHLIVDAIHLKLLAVHCNCFVHSIQGYVMNRHFRRYSRIRRFKQDIRQYSVIWFEFVNLKAQQWRIIRIEHNLITRAITAKVDDDFGTFGARQHQFGHFQRLREQ